MPQDQSSRADARRPGAGWRSWLAALVVHTPGSAGVRELLALAALYTVVHAAAVGLGFFAIKPPGAAVTPFWPSSGLLFACLLCARLPAWPVLAATAMAAEIGLDAAAGVLTAPGFRPGWAVYFSSLNVLEAGAGAALARIWLPRMPIMDLVAVVRLIGAALAGTGVAAVPAALGLEAAGIGAAFGADLQTWWAADLLGILVVAPVVLASGARVLYPRAFAPVPVAETMLICAVNLAVVGWVFSATGAWQLVFDLPYVIFPPLIWAALRLPISVVTCLLLAVMMLAAVCTRFGFGPFAQDAGELFTRLFPMQMFLVVIAVATLILCSVVLQWRRSLEELRESNRRLARSEARLRDHALELTTVEEKTRRSIADDIHDTVAQLLASASMDVGLLTVPQDDDSRASRLQRLRGTIRDCIREVRSITAQLVPVGLYDLGLAAALQGLADRLRDLHGLEVTLHVDCDLETVPQDVAVAAYRAVQFTLRGVVDHGGMERVSVRLDCRDTALYIEVEDGGAGDGDDVAHGEALRRVADRIELLGGRFEAERTGGGAAVVRMCLPLTGPGG